MDLIQPWMWLIAGLGLLVAELITPTFFFGIVGVGALIASLIDLIIPLDQFGLVAFFFGSGAAAYLARRYDLYSSGQGGLKTGPDRMIDKTGVVEEAIDQTKGTGIVVVEGERWRAKSEHDEVIQSGSEVVVSGVEGTTLTVWELEKGIEDTQGGVRNVNGNS